MIHPRFEYRRKRISADEYERLQSLPQEELFALLARRYLEFERDFTKVVDRRRGPFYRWFPDGRLDLFSNLLGKHLHGGQRNKAALIWRGIQGQERIHTYATLAQEVRSLASAMQHLGVKPGDHVLLFLPNLPEQVVSMLACASIGALHVVYHMSYAAESVSQRISHCQPSMIITSDGSPLRTRTLKSVVDEALERSEHEVAHCLVVAHTGFPVHMKPKRDLWYHQLIADPEYTHGDITKLRSADEALFMLYISGKSRTRRGIVHSIGGYLTWAQFTTELLFDMEDYDILWNTSDLAWIHGHSYAVYGPLGLGATVFLYEGAISYENTSLFFDCLDKYQITVLYTAPSVLRSVMRAKSTRRYVNRYSNSLRFVGCGGEMLQEDVYKWTQYELTNKRNLPITQIWGQTETGGGLIAGVPGVLNYKDDTMMRPLPGVQARIVDKQGQAITETYVPGRLVLTAPLPSMLMNVYRDDETYRQVYWEKYPKHQYYATGDSAYYDENQNVVLAGRMDSFLSAGAGRRSLVEIEEVVRTYRCIKDCAAIVIDHPAHGYMLVLFCVLKNYRDESYREQTLREIKEHIIEESGELNLPDTIRFTKYLPKNPDNTVNKNLLQEIAVQMEGI